MFTVYLNRKFNEVCAPYLTQVSREVQSWYEEHHQRKQEIAHTAAMTSEHVTMEITTSETQATTDGTGTQEEEKKTVVTIPHVEQSDLYGTKAFDELDEDS